MVLQTATESLTFDPFKALHINMGETRCLQTLYEKTDNLYFFPPRMHSHIYSIVGKKINHFGNAN